MNSANLKKLIFLSSIIILSIILVPQISFEIQDNNQIINQQATKLSGIIPANSFYIIRDANGRSITKGKSDSNGVFVTSSVDIDFSKSNKLTLESLGITTSVETIPKQRNIVFPKIKTNLLFSIENPADDFGYDNMIKLFLYSALAKAKAPGSTDGAMWALIEAATDAFYDDNTPISERINYIQEILDQLEERLRLQFYTLNSRYDNYFAYQVTKDMNLISSTSSIVNNDFKTLIILLNEDKYNAFWTSHPEYKSLINKKYEDLTEDEKKQLEDLWKVLLEYDKNNGSKVTDLLNEIYKNTLRNASDEYSFKSQNINANSLFDSAQKQTSQKTLGSYIDYINKATIDYTMPNNKSYEICSGAEKEIIAIGYVRTFDNINNIYKLHFATINAGKVGIYANTENLKKDYFNIINELKTNTSKALNNCSFFEKNGSGWPSITYQTILSNDKPYLIVVAPLRDLSDIIDANKLAYESQSLRKKIFSPEQNIFFDTLQDYLDSTEQQRIGKHAGITNGTFIAYYALENTNDINNYNKIVKEDNPDKSEISVTKVSYNKVEIITKDISSDGYSLLFSNGSSLKIKKGSNSYHYIFPTKEWSISSSNQYVTLLNDKNIAIQSQNIKFNISVIPRLHLDNSKIWTNFGDKAGFNNDKYWTVDYGENIGDFRMDTDSSQVSSITKPSNHKTTKFPYEKGKQFVHFDMVKRPYEEKSIVYNFKIYFLKNNVKQAVNYSCNFDKGYKSCGEITWSEPEFKYSF